MKHSESDLLRAGRSGDRIPVETRFFAPVQTGPGDHPASCVMRNGSLSRPGRGVTNRPPYSAEVKEKVELWPSRPVPGRNLLTFYF